MKSQLQHHKIPSTTPSQHMPAQSCPMQDSQHLLTSAAITSSASAAVTTPDLHFDLRTLPVAPPPDTHTAHPATSPTHARLALSLQRRFHAGSAQEELTQKDNASSPSSQKSSPLAQRIRAAIGKGHSMENGVRHSLEQELRTDLSHVRLHTDSEADKLSRSVQAVAFTTGTDIFFRSGTYRPNTTQGIQLLTHETMHTLQQSAGAVDGTPATGGISISHPQDRFERAAEASAAHVTARIQRMHLQNTMSSPPQRDKRDAISTPVSSHDPYISRTSPTFYSSRVSTRLTLQRAFPYRDNPSINEGWIVEGPYSNLMTPANEMSSKIGEGFGGRTKKIKEQNAKNNGGLPRLKKVTLPIYYVSDTTKEGLTDQRAYNDQIPHVDHIIPAAKLGSNSFRNAVVISGRDNTRKNKTFPDETALVKGWVRKAGPEELKQAEVPLPFAEKRKKAEIPETGEKIKKKTKEEVTIKDKEEKGVEVVQTARALPQIHIQRFFKDNPLINGGWVVEGPYAKQATAQTEAEAEIGKAFSGPVIDEVHQTNQSQNKIDPGRGSGNFPIEATVVNISDWSGDELLDSRGLEDHTIEVDHIIPLSLNGSNSIRNALVRSRKENSEKSNKKFPDPLAREKGWLREATEEEMKAAQPDAEAYQKKQAQEKLKKEQVAQEGANLLDTFRTGTGKLDVSQILNLIKRPNK